MTSPYELLVAPFVEFGFMRRALVACLALSLGAGPVGTILVLRRMSLVGDALSHALLPGVAIGFLVGGLSLGAMAAGGLAAGLTVALLSGLVTRATAQREDASFAAFYLISLAAGVVIVSKAGSNLDLLHLLFGTILSVDDAGLLSVAGVATVTLLALAVIYRPLIVDCFDPGFLRALGARGGLCHGLFLTLLVLNLVGGFQALGTLMVVGLMMLPAVAARFWAREAGALMLTSIAIAFTASTIGLLVSYHADLPSGPVMILSAGACYLLSLLMGREGGLVARWRPHVHRAA